MLLSLKEKILSGRAILKEEALGLAALNGIDIFALFAQSFFLRERFRGKKIDLCAIVNAKSGACPEDCAYCAQSARADTGAKSYPLLPEGLLLDAAKRAKEAGAKRFCIVTSGRVPNPAELGRIASAISKISALGLLPCATLGLMDYDALIFLKEAGLVRYHHNLETSEKFFSNVCTSHSYNDKLKTVHAVKKAGLSLCSGGIFGLGESWEDRVDMALLLKELDADSVPINFLIPVKGTKLGERSSLPPFEALKIISLLRHILPEKEIRVCGGRLQCLGELNPFVLMAGADGLLTGDYLTREGVHPDADLKLIREYGLEPA
jgi:biotin synthase